MTDQPYDIDKLVADAEAARSEAETLESIAKHFYEGWYDALAVDASDIVALATVAEFIRDHGEAIIALARDYKALHGFAQEIMDRWPDGDVDGGDLQDIAVKHGLLKPESRTERCAEHGCRCAEDYGFADGEERVCYRKAGGIE